MNPLNRTEVPIEAHTGEAGEQCYPDIYVGEFGEGEPITPLCLTFHEITHIVIGIIVVEREPTLRITEELVVEPGFPQIPRLREPHQ